MNHVVLFNKKKENRITDVESRHRNCMTCQVVHNSMDHLHKKLVWATELSTLSSNMNYEMSAKTTPAGKSIATEDSIDQNTISQSFENYLQTSWWDLKSWTQYPVWVQVQANAWLTPIWIRLRFKGVHEYDCNNYYLTRQFWYSESKCRYLMYLKSKNVMHLRMIFILIKCIINVGTYN